MKTRYTVCGCRQCRIVSWTVWVLILILLLTMGSAVMALLAESRVSIRTKDDARVVMSKSTTPEGTLTVICTVPPHADNRWLTIGIGGYMNSGIQLDGEGAWVTHIKAFRNVPCGVDAAFCGLKTTTGPEVVVTLPILVAGCDSTTD